MGGGLGHLTRAYSFLHHFNLFEDAYILTSSAFAEDERIIDKCPIIKVDKNFETDISSFQEFIGKTFNELNIQTLYLDSFPLGIIGEFSDFDFQNIEVNYLARLLRWDIYKKFLNSIPPKFNKTYLLEPLSIEHQKFINDTSAAQTKLGLVYPKPNLNRQAEKILQGILQNHPRYWLIVHSGNEDEVFELIASAKEMQEIEKSDADLIVISPISVNYPKIFQYNFYPAFLLFESAERIFSACGFNVMKQTEAFADKHFCLPFPRHFDDQYERARRRRKNSINK